MVYNMVRDFSHCVLFQNAVPSKWEQLSFNIYLDHFKNMYNFLDTPKLISTSWGPIV